MTGPILFPNLVGLGLCDVDLAACYSTEEILEFLPPGGGSKMVGDCLLDSKVGDASFEVMLVLYDFAGGVSFKEL